MLKRALTVAFLVAVAAGFMLAPADDVAAAGSLTVRMVCEPSFNGAFCELRPFSVGGPGRTVRWNSSGSISVSPIGANAPVADAYCSGGGSGGTVTVTVVAANGSTGSATRWVSCYGGLF